MDREQGGRIIHHSWTEREADPAEWGEMSDLYREGLMSAFDAVAAALETEHEAELSILTAHVELVRKQAYRAGTLGLPHEAYLTYEQLNG